MRIFSIIDGSEIVIHEATAAEIHVSLESGESFELETPIGEGKTMNVERTIDTFMVTDYEGMINFNAIAETGTWRKEFPLTNEELERRRYEFEQSEARARDIPV